MRLNLVLKISSRYLLAKGEDRFIGFISKITITAVALGVSVLIVVLSVMNGFAEQFRERILGSVPHAFLAAQSPKTFEHWEQKARSLKASNPHIEGVAPIALSQAVLLSPRGGAGFAQIAGVLPDSVSQISRIPSRLIEGDLNSLSEKPYRIALGLLLAESLGVSVGGKVNILIPGFRVSLLGLMPRMREFTVSGIFDTASEIDKSAAFINLSDYNALLGQPKENIQSLGIRYDDPTRVKEYLRKLPEWVFKENIIQRDWTDSFGALYSAIQTEKHMVGLLLFSIILVASFSILSTLVMSVKEKRGDIAILRTLGLHQGEVLAIFITQGLLIGLLGSFIGLLVGTLLALNITHIYFYIEYLFNADFINANTYFINYLPSRLQWQDLCVVVLSTLLIATLATIYPAYRAGRVKPADVLGS